MWARLHRVLLERLHGADKLDWRRASLDSAAVPAERGRGDGAEPDRPRRRPDKRHTDKGYDHRFCRIECSRRGITPRIARRGVEDSRRLGPPRTSISRSRSSPPPSSA